MNPVAGPFAIASVLLVLGGALKALDPGDTATALRGVGLAIPRIVVRLGAALEVGIGGYALVAGDRVAAVAVACSYAVFAVFVAVALVKDAPIATCGCFGKADTPPSLVHLGIDLGAVLVAVAVVVDPGVGIRSVIDEQPLAGVPYLMLVTLGVYVSFLALTLVPRTMSLVRARSER